jgi:hypothetical protein
MDRSTDFFSLVENHTSSIFPSNGPSSFLLKASEILRKMDAFHGRICTCYDLYLGFHKYLPSSSPQSKSQDPLVLSAAERKAVNGEIDAFVTTVASVIHELNNIIDENKHQTNSGHHVSIKVDNVQVEQFYRQVLSYLMNRFTTITKVTEVMQNRKNISPNPVPLPYILPHISLSTPYLLHRTRVGNAKRTSAHVR